MLRTAGRVGRLEGPLPPGWARQGGSMWEKWEVLLGIRLLGTTFAADCQTIRLPLHIWALDKQSFHWVLKNIVECRPPLGAPPLSLSMVCRRRGGGGTPPQEPRGRLSRLGSHACACGHFRAQTSGLLNQSYMSKGTWRQGIGSFVRNSHVSTLCPVVICPYLCTSDKWGSCMPVQSLLYQNLDSVRNAQVRAYDDRAQCWNIGIPYKRAYVLSSYALTYAALMLESSKPRVRRNEFAERLYAESSLRRQSCCRQEAHWMGLRVAQISVRPISVLRFRISEGLTQAES